MPMFIWRSGALKSYSTGWIIVHAPTVEMARKAVLQRALDRFHNEYTFSIEEDDPDVRATYIGEFAADINAEPTIETVLFVRGSD